MTDATYLRISDDKLGLELGVDRQRADTTALAVEPIEFCDNDISATKGRHRPRYAALVAAIRAGRVKRVIVWHQSRIWRNRRERADGIDLFRQHGVTLVCVKGPTLDMSTAYGRGVAGLLGEFDTLEADMIGERVARALQQRIEQGLPPTGTRLFGYTADGMTLVPDEARQVADLFAAFLAGRSLRALAAEAGLASKTLRQRLGNPRYAGFVIRGGVEYPGSWAKVVDRATWQAARAILDDESRRTNPYKGGPRVKAMLGSGLFACQRCERPVFAGRNGSKQPAYRCLVCGRAWGRDMTDQAVDLLVRERLGRGDLADLLPVDRPDLEQLRAEAAGIRGRLKRLPTDYVLLGLDDQQVAEANRAGKARLTQIEAALAESMRGTVLGALVACDDPVAEWAGIPSGQIDRRQTVIRAVMTITLGKPPSGRPRDPERALAGYVDCIQVGPPRM